MQHNAFENSVLGQIGSLIEEVNATQTKRAASPPKKAADGIAELGTTGQGSKDPGGYTGASTHPSAKADGNTHPAPAGFRASENKKDVEKDVPNNVESAGENTGDIKSDIVQIGTHKAPTGEDHSVERDFKGDKDDPGTTHPADAEDVGEKYSAMRFPELYKLACAKLENVVARIAANEPIKQAAAPANGRPAPTPATPAKAAAANQPTPQASAQAGYELASMAAALGEDVNDPNFQKFAAANNVVYRLMQEGYDEGDLVGQFLYKTAAYEEELLRQKQAAEAPMGGAMEGAPGMEAGPPGGAPPMPGGDPTGGAPPGGAPPMPGGDPSGGAPPPGGGAEGGGGNMDEAVNEMANAIVQAGMPVDKLIAALQAAMAGGGGGGMGGEMGGGGGGMGGEMGGAPPGGEKAGGAKGLTREDMAALIYHTKRAKDHMASGRFRLKSPTKEAANDRNEMVNYFNYVKEVLGIR